MLTSSSKPWGDVGDNLTNFFKEMEQKRERQKLEAQVRTLKQNLKTLKLKEQRLIERLNNKAPSPKKSRKASGNADRAETIDLRQKMDLYRICFGMTGTKHEPGTGKLVFRFHPISNGQMFGPYQTVLNRTPTDKIRIDSFQMPVPGTFEAHPERQLMQRNRKERLFRKFQVEPYPVLPIEDLEKSYLDNVDLSPSTFAREVRQCLTAYVSRLDQVKNLEAKFGSEISDLSTNSNLTEVTFTLKIDDVTEQETPNTSGQRKTICLRLKMNYDVNVWLPRVGGLKIDISSLGVEDDDDGKTYFDILKDQCKIFNHKRLDQALQNAFGEE